MDVDIDVVGDVVHQGLVGIIGQHNLKYNEQKAATRGVSRTHTSRAVFCRNNPRQCSSCTKLQDIAFAVELWVIIEVGGKRT